MSSASGRDSSTTARASAMTSTSSICAASLPLAICASYSSASTRPVSRVTPKLARRSTSFCGGDRGDSVCRVRRWSWRCTDVSGVRSSCDTSRRKLVFTALARSASSRARRVSSSAASTSCLRVVTSPASEARSRVWVCAPRSRSTSRARFIADEVRHPRPDLLHDERLHEVVLRAVAQELDAERVVRPRRQDQHRHALELRPRPELADAAGRRSSSAS